MKDIVERLRNLAERFSKCTDQETCAEAADEIERLRVELASERNHVAGLRVEIARLREALERIANTEHDWRTVWFHDVARAALAGEEKK